MDCNVSAASVTRYKDGLVWTNESFFRGLVVVFVVVVVCRFLI